MSKKRTGSHLLQEFDRQLNDEEGNFAHLVELIKKKNWKSKKKITRLKKIIDASQPLYLTRYE